MQDGTVLKSIRCLLGSENVLTGQSAETYCADWRGIDQSFPIAVAMPSNVIEISQIVRLCAAVGVPIVPQGGNTGLVGGALVPFGQGALVVSTRKLNMIRAVDPVGFTLTAEAGCILADVQAAAEAVDRLFPLSLGAEGSCTIGGNLSSNAGGILTIRYGNARDLVLGLEVVLADGRVWNGLRALRKDNTGYDLKHLFLGAEGTLGIITAATLKLFPRPIARETAFIALPSPAAAVALLADLRAGAGEAVTAFELIPRFAIDGARTLLGRSLDPLATAAPWYALTELGSSLPGAALRPALEQVLASGMERGLVLDATLAGSGEQRRALWTIREALPEIGRKVGGAVHHDIAVPVDRVADLIDRAGTALDRMIPGIRPYPFGHVGDGNIHYNIARPEGMSGPDFLARAGEITRLVHDITAELGGSISAEHGIGGRKRGELARLKQPLELELMRRVKAALDPQGLMNPGKVLPDPE